MRLIATFLFACILGIAMSIGAVPALANGDDPVCVQWDDRTGTCEVWSEGGTTSTRPPDSNSLDVKPPPRDCYSEGRVVIPCRTKDGYWSSVYHCYIKPYTGPDAKERAAELDVGDDEMLAACTRAEGDDSERMQIIVIPKGEADPPPDPRVIAWQLAAQINITAGQIGLVPDSDNAMVGLPTWMWVDNPGPHTTGPISESTSVRGYTVTIEAKLSKVVYSMGDGTTVTCAGTNAAGTPYLDRYGVEPSPTCGHWYEKPGDYTVTARSVWTINWYGVGQAGTLSLDVQRSLDLAVLEGHAVVR